MEIGPDGLLEALRGRRVLLTGPAESDGDSIGACLALRRALAGKGVLADVTAKPGWRYADLPDASTVVGDDALAGYDAVVVMDGDRHRLSPGARRSFADAAVQAIVDHHRSTRPDEYTHAWVDPSATSTCSMVGLAFRDWGVAVDANSATLLYAGLAFDTGGFRHGNTRPDTHRFAAELIEAGADHVVTGMRILFERRSAGLLGTARIWAQAEFVLDGAVAIGFASKDVLGDLAIEASDLEGVVDGLVGVTGVQVGCLLVERGAGTKASLRSHGAVDVAAVARSLSPGGGGHPRAAGVYLEVPVRVARDRIVDALRASLPSRSPTP